MNSKNYTASISPMIGAHSKLYSLRKAIIQNLSPISSIYFSLSLCSQFVITIRAEQISLPPQKALLHRSSSPQRILCQQFCFEDTEFRANQGSLWDVYHIFWSSSFRRRQSCWRRWLGKGEIKSTKSHIPKRISFFSFHFSFENQSVNFFSYSRYDTFNDRLFKFKTVNLLFSPIFISKFKIF